MQTTQAAPHIIVYSHGFGIRKEDRGLFTDIAKAFTPESKKGADCFLFDNVL